MDPNRPSLPPEPSPSTAPPQEGGASSAAPAQSPPAEPPECGAVVPEPPPGSEGEILATIPPSVLLEAMRAPWGIAGRVFAGFRPVATSLKLPAVRRRIGHELSTNPELRASLWSLWLGVHRELRQAIAEAEETDVAAQVPDLVAKWGVERVRLALLGDEREAVCKLAEGDLAAPPPAEVSAAPPEAAKAPPAEERQAARLRAKIQELRSEVTRQRAEHSRLEHELAQALRAAEQWRADAGEGQREAAEARRATERQARQLEKQQKAAADLEAQLKESRREQRRLAEEISALRRQEEASARARAEREATLPPAEAWLQATRELIRQGQAQSAVNLLAPLALRHPGSLCLRETLAEGYQALGALPAAVTELCRLARGERDAGRLSEALRLAFRALGFSPTDEAAQRCLRELATEAARAGDGLWTAARRELAAMERQSPPAYRAASQILQNVERTGAATPGRRIGLDTPLEWPGEGGTFKAPLRRVLHAIDANESDVVQRVRGALATLEQRAPEERRALLAAIARQDDSYRNVLVRRTRPVVVDGSNVAWFGQEGSRPRLRQLEAIRRELRSLGYFPIHVWIDAALRHQIDQRGQLEHLIDQGEIFVADAGTDADEQILRDARELGCAVVTNDRMAEHDPRERVPKKHFEVGPDGAAIWD